MMLRVRFLCLALAVVCILSMSTVAMAAEVDCDSTYCFSSEDFTTDTPLRGICVTNLPDPETGTVMLGCRVIRCGDILSAGQLDQLTFQPLRTQEDQDAVMTYLPIYENKVEVATTMSIAVRGKEDQAPVAQDSSMETYKNLSNKDKLHAQDPEGQDLSYTVTREPKRGTVTIHADGTFTYTPKKNKVGVDSFTYTATDPAGNVSREATVTIQILKPTDSKLYTDTDGLDCRFEAEWMRNTGLFVGEKIGNKEFFQPDKAVSRGEFLAMLVKTLDIPTEDSAAASLPEDTPDWLRPYLAAAIRSGLTAGWPETEGESFCADQPITGAEAAVMLQNALDLNISQETLEETAASEEEVAEVPAWAALSLTAMAENGIALQAGEAMTRGDVAQVLYQVSQLAQTAPGLAIYPAAE